jgi:GGDEF domain-containing protein
MVALKQYVGLFSDVSARKEAEAFIHHLAYHDPLTGLANRRLFCDRLEMALRQAQRNQSPTGCIDARSGSLQGRQ